jgi:hypothetical protein
MALATLPKVLALLPDDQFMCVFSFVVRARAPPLSLSLSPPSIPILMKPFSRPLV